MIQRNMCLFVCMLSALSFPASAGHPGRNIVKNGDFEKFSGDEPVGWETTNIPKFCTVVTPTTKCHGGKYAAKCEVKNCSGAMLPGMIQQKNIPIKGKTFQMHFYYLLKSANGDVGYISMEFKNAEGSTIRMCEERLTSSKADFAQFATQFSAPSEATHGDLKIALLATAKDGTVHEGSAVIIDDIVLSEISGEEH